MNDISSRGCPRKARHDQVKQNTRVGSCPEYDFIFLCAYHPAVCKRLEPVKQLGYVVRLNVVRGEGDGERRKWRSTEHG